MFISPYASHDLETLAKKITKLIDDGLVDGTLAVPTIEANRYYVVSFDYTDGGIQNVGANTTKIAKPQWLHVYYEIMKAVRKLPEYQLLVPNPDVPPDGLVTKIITERLTHGKLDDSAIVKLVERFQGGTTGYLFVLLAGIVLKVPSFSFLSGEWSVLIRKTEIDDFSADTYLDLAGTFMGGRPVFSTY